MRLGRHEPSLARAHVILPHHPKNLATIGCGITLRNSRNGLFPALPLGDPQYIIDMRLTADSPCVLVHLTDELLKASIPNLIQISPRSGNVLELDLPPVLHDLRISQSTTSSIILGLVFVLHELKQRRRRHLGAVEGESRDHLTLTVVVVCGVEFTDLPVVRTLPNPSLSSSLTGPAANLPDHTTTDNE